MVDIFTRYFTVGRLSDEIVQLKVIHNRWVLDHIQVFIRKRLAHRHQKHYGIVNVLNLKLKLESNRAILRAEILHSHGRH